MKTMKKIFTKAVTIISICILLLSYGGVCYAAGIQPRFTNIVTARSAISLDGKTVNVSAYLTCRDTSSIEITMKLQKEENGSWTTVKSWTEQFSGKIGNMQKSYTLANRGNYRVSSSFQASGEKTSNTSTKVTY